MRGHLKLDAGDLMEITHRRQQNHELALSLAKKPETILQAPNRFLVTNIDFFVLRRHRDGRIVRVIDQAPGQVDPFMRILFLDPAEMSDRCLGAEKPVECSLQVSTHPIRELPLRDGDVGERDRTKVCQNQA